MLTSEAIAGRLLDEDEAADLIDLIADRVFPSKPAQDTTLPYLVFYLTGGGGMNTVDGPSRLQPRSLRVEGYDRDEAGSAAVLDAATAVLDGWRDRENGIQGCFAEEDADQQTDGELEISGQTFRLWHTGSW